MEDKCEAWIIHKMKKTSSLITIKRRNINNKEFKCGFPVTGALVEKVSSRINRDLTVFGFFPLLEKTFFMIGHLPFKVNLWELDLMPLKIYI